MKENIKSVVVLTAICLVVAVLLAYTNSITAPIIAENQAAAANESLTIVMPDAAGFEDLTPSLTLPETVTGVYKETSGLGFVMLVNATSDYSGGNPMTFTVAIDATGTISAVELTGYYDSKDFGPDYPQSYVGQNSTLADITLVAGCTYSSVAFKDSITSAFNVLIENNLVAEAQKSEEQLISEALPLALSGCVNATNIPIADPIEGFSDPITQAYKAKNNCGYIYVMNGGSYGSVIVGINAFGVGRVYSLDGSDITADCAGLIETAAAANPVIATANLEANTATVAACFEEGAVVTPVENLGGFEDVTAAFTVTVGEETQYAVITQPLGYGDEAMKMLTIFNANGEIVVYKTLTELILHGEYYSAHELTDEGAYRAQFVGLSESTYSDDMTLVAGATMTANAVASNFNSAFEAFNLIKEVVG
ncbi:MAG: FMN-binding protein [Oscillospiraceae bacterium]|nr:FMN-binding protein [Oscillospiraceae bacterium]